MGSRSLFSDATQESINEQHDQEKAIKDKMDKRCKALTDAMKKQMACRKKKKVRKLKQQHEAELEQVIMDMVRGPGQGERCFAFFKRGKK